VLSIITFIIEAQGGFMRRLFSLTISLILFLLACTSFVGEAETENRILVLTVEGPLTPAMVKYLDRGLQRAEQESYAALIFQMTTPGGSIELMDRMVQSIRASRVPVIVYIAPRGGIAGSAGTVITLAGHAAAMAPETAIGAASPVGGQGEDLGETIEAKTKNILKAQVRSLAAWRGEDAVALAESTIESAEAVSAVEALEAGLVDFIASDVDDLVNQLGGFTLTITDETFTLATGGYEIVPLRQTLIEELLQVLTNPNVTFLLLIVGLQAVLIEISSPGGWVAGFIGVVSLALGTLGLGVLPVNWFGLVFLVTAFVLFIVDVKAPTHGALTVAGIASLIVGGLVLFNSPSTPSFQRVSVGFVVGVSLVTAALFMTVLAFAIKAQQRPVETGAVTLVGKTAEARSEFTPMGMVQVAGELWSAVLADDSAKVAVGDRVEVVEVDGLRLKVRKVKMKAS
jgi:membrane-bound serine protease (ClpP class)